MISTRATHLALIAVSLCVTACSKPLPDDRVISGTVTYRERMSMPPDAVIDVSVQDVSLQDVKSVLIERVVINADGRQVPIAFELQVDPADVDERMTYALRATISTADGQLLWTTDTMYPVLTRGASDGGNELILRKIQHEAPEEPAMSGASVFVCESEKLSFSFTIEPMAGEAALWLPAELGGGYFSLPHVPAASGAKYEGEGIVVWLKGDEAMLEFHGTHYTGCRRDPYRSIWEGAKLSGVDYRAVGNEPGWHLEIRNDETIMFVYNYGDSTVVVPAPAPDVDQDNRTSTYNAKSDVHELTVIIKGESCSDTMSDESFEGSVTVILDGRTFNGCGRALH